MQGLAARLAEQGGVTETVKLSSKANCAHAGAVHLSASYHKRCRSLMLHVGNFHRVD